MSLNVNTSNNTCVKPMAGGALFGAAAGVALKYIYPLNTEEKNTREYKTVINEINNKKNIYSPWTKSYLEGIENKKIRSSAEDVFVSTYKGMHNGESVGSLRLIKAFHKIKELKPDEYQELKKLFLSAREQAEKMAKKHVEIYNLATKHIRPTGFFVGVGAIAGAAVALANNILKTDIQ